MSEAIIFIMEWELNIKIQFEINSHFKFINNKLLGYGFKCKILSSQLKKKRFEF